MKSHKQKLLKLSGQMMIYLAPYPLQSRIIVLQPASLCGKGSSPFAAIAAARYQTASLFTRVTCTPQLAW